MLAISTTNVIELSNLLNTVTGAYVNNATVTATLKTLAGVTLETVTLDYVADSNGTYRGNIPADAELEQDKTYVIAITAVAGADEVLLQELHVAEYI